MQEITANGTWSWGTRETLTIDFECSTIRTVVEDIYVYSYDVPDKRRCQLG